MAHAQRLSETNKTLTSRIHELESALAQAHAKDDGTHPLLQSDLDLNPDGDHDNNLNHVSEAIGSLSIGLDGQSKYHGESAGSEVSSMFQPLQLLKKDLTLWWSSTFKTSSR